MLNGFGRVLKGLGLALGIVILLLFAFFVLVYLPPVQTFLTSRGERVASNSLGTNVTVKNIHLRFPGLLAIKGVLIPDLKKDTLLYCEEIALDLKLFPILGKQVNLSRLNIQNLKVNLHNSPADSTFNYQFILEALGTSPKASGPVQPPDESSNAWKFILGNVNLSDIGAVYEDRLLNNSYRIMLGELILPFEEFDLSNQKYLAGDIKISDSQIGIRQMVNPPDSSEGADLFWDFQSLMLTAVDITYQSPDQIIESNLGEVTIITKHINSLDQFLDLEQIEVLNSKFTYEIPVNAADGDSAGTAAATTDSDNWKLKVEHLTLEDNRISLDNKRAQTVEGFDFNHLSFNQLNAQIQDLSYDSKNLQASFKEMSFEEKSGLTLQQLHMDLHMTPRELSLIDLELKTPDSHLFFKLILNYSSLESLAQSLEEISLEFDLKESQVAIRDLLYFQPSLLDELALSLDADQILKLKTHITGTVGDLSIHDLMVSGPGGTSLLAVGRITGLPDPGNLFFDITKAEMHTSKRDLQTMLPGRLWPSNLNLPENLQIKAQVKGQFRDFTGNIQAQTSQGAGHADFALQTDHLMEQARYNLSIFINHYDLGNLLKQDTLLGSVTMEISFEGQGLTVRNAKTQIKAIVKEAVVKDYLYQDLAIEGRLEDQAFTGTAQIDDPNLQLDFEGSASLSDEATYQFQLGIFNADLQALGLTTDDIKTRGILTAMVRGSEMSSLTGRIGLKEAEINKDGIAYPIDSLVLESFRADGKTDLKIESELLSAHFGGTINLQNLFPVLKRHFNRYYNLEEEPQLGVEPAQNFEFDINIKQTNLLTEVLLPDLEKVRPGQLSGVYDSRDHRLDLDLTLPLIVYKGVSLDSLTFQVNSDAQALHYALVVPNLYWGQYNLKNASVSGQVSGDSLYLALNVTDSIDNDWYHLGMLFQNIEGINTIKFIPSETLFNYTRWEVSKDNHIKLTSVPDFHNVQFTHDGREFSLETTTGNGDSTLVLNFKSFRLSTISNVLEEDKRFIGGTLNGNINLTYYQGQPLLSSDLMVNGLVIMDSDLGNLSLRVEADQSESYQINGALQGPGNEISLLGEYHYPNASWDLNAQIANLDLASLTPLTLGYITKMTGMVKGNMQFQGTTNAPLLLGGIRFQQAVIQPELLNVPLKINDQEIKFKPQEITFQNFQIQDSLDNQAVLNGKIQVPDLNNIRYELQLTANKFLLMNSTDSQNSLYYGKLMVDSRVDVEGALTSPVINAYLKLKEGSNFTYVIPETNAEIISSEGVVTFVDMDQLPSDEPILGGNTEDADDSLRVTLQGIELVANIEIDQNTELKILVDQQAGDNLAASGNGTLSFEMDPNGEMRLSGRYEIAQGSYQLSFYDFVKRKFDIQKGSSITWSGDPFKARLDITAAYSVETSPEDLMGLANPEGGSQPALPFQVILHMRNELMAPDISFEITLPEEQKASYGDVSLRLEQLSRDQSELNKQVFSLIVFKRFLSEGNSTGGFVNAGNTARSSVSKLLTQQLNRIANNIEGVDLSFDLQSSETNTSTGSQGQTDLELALSKKLFNDRLIIRVGGNINLEGSREEQEGNANNFGGDLLIEYELTEDGRYRLKGFRRSDYDALLKGDLIETGIGFVFIRDYNDFSELFTKTKKNSQ